MPSKKKKDREKTVDLPPTGSRNPDPITDAPGSHPIETGIGAAVGGAATGLAAGAVAGPVGAVVGAAAGAVAGGYAGKGIGELIDPTTEDNWLRESFGKKKYVHKGETYEHYVPAYRYGAEAESRHRGKRFEEVEGELRAGWDQHRGTSSMTWDRARHAVRDAFDRTVQLREERLRVQKEPVQTGEVKVRKEVTTDTETMRVPVEREEVVIERRPVGGHKTTKEEVRAGEEVRIPVKEEKVNVGKEAVVKEEVSVGKRKVQDTKEVSGTVRKEKLKVEEKGDVDVHHKGKKK